jgi:branched-chain amino acid transport system ATP-binding protein
MVEMATASGAAMTLLLGLNGISKSFGGLHVNRDLSFDLLSGDRVALIGPNGAGKTTLVNIISGDLAPTEGRITFDGEDITGLSIAHRAHRGLVRTFQITRLFSTLTATENIALAVMQRKGMTRRFLSVAGKASDVRDECRELLQLLGIDHLAGLRVSELRAAAAAGHSDRPCAQAEGPAPGRAGSGCSAR